MRGQDEGSQLRPADADAVCARERDELEAAEPGGSTRNGEREIAHADEQQDRSEGDVQPEASCQCGVHDDVGEPDGRRGSDRRQRHARIPEHREPGREPREPPAQESAGEPAGDDRDQADRAGEGNADPQEGATAADDERAADDQDGEHERVEDPLGQQRADDRDP